MSALAGGWEPLSVRRGIREPFRLVEGIPPHARAILDDWVAETIRVSRTATDELVRFIISSLRLPFDASYPSHLTQYVRDDDNAYLDILDLMSAIFPQHRHDLEKELETAGSAWKVDPENGRLMRRVPAEAQAAYELALEREPSAAEHLSGAWEHAFGRNPDAGDAWGDAVKALEAALHPIISPNNSKATLGTMKGELRDAPDRKFVIRAPGENPKATLLGMLEAVPYEDGRHPTDDRKATLDVARVVVFQTTAIIAGISQGLIERSEA